MSTERIAIALRIPKDSLERIDQAANAHGLSRTDYMVRSSTGELPNTTSEAFRRIKTVEERLQRIEDYAFNN